jgi:hypothetical protein
LNDIGFLRRTDNVNYWAFTQYRINRITGIFRFQSYRLNHERNYDFGGQLLNTSYNFRSDWQFLNLWRFNQGLSIQGPSVANSDLRGGPALAYPGGVDYWYWISTNDQKPFRVSFSNSYYWGAKDWLRSAGVSLTLVWRPVDALSMSLSPSVNWQENALQYIPNENESEGIFTLGNIYQETYRMTMRANLNITPNLTLEYWGEPFISTGVYNDFKRVSNATASKYDDRFEPIQASWASFEDGTYFIDEDGDLSTDYQFRDPDFNIVQFRSNLVMRWEYIPGSEFFLAWSSNGSFFDQSDGAGFRNLSSQLAQLRGNHTFLLKYTYRFIL